MIVGILYCISVLIFVILIKWVLHNMSNMEKNNKIIYLSVGITLICILTLFIFKISSSKIDYPNEKVKSQMQSMLLPLFISINALGVLPYIANIMEKIKLKEIKEDELKKKLIIFCIIFVICIFFECKYIHKTELRNFRFLS